MNQGFCSAVYFNQLWTLDSKHIHLNVAQNKTGWCPIVDVVQSGFYQVMGKGRLLKLSVTVRDKFLSRNTEEKVVK